MGDSVVKNYLDCGLNDFGIAFPNHAQSQLDDSLSDNSM